jgi:spore maturation protein CgeB
MAPKLKLDSNPSFEDESLDIPLHITDILSICKEYSQLTFQIQKQIEDLSEVGVQEAISSGCVKSTSLPLIKKFLTAISNNLYFGDAADQASALHYQICLFEEANEKNVRLLSLN